MAAGHIFTPFTPTVSIAASTSSARVARTLLPNSQQTPCELRIMNPGSSIIFVEFGDSTVVASALTSMPILPSSVESFMINPAITHVAAIMAAGTGTLYVTTGLGV